MIEVDYFKKIYKSIIVYSEEEKVFLNFLSFGVDFVILCRTRRFLFPLALATFIASTFDIVFIAML